MRITCQRIGLPPISTSALGIEWVRSCSRVPRPPQRIATGTSAASATGDGGKDRHFVAVRELGVEAVLKADVLARDIDVDEAPQRPIFGDPGAKVRVRVEDRIERFADRLAVDLDLSPPRR